jgi:hypothetical protein
MKVFCGIWLIITGATIAINSASLISVYGASQVIAVTVGVVIIAVGANMICEARRKI